ncbi:hypothetical protein [Brevundimonas subvibrioides]|uniref:hypothetical protein n=1 Tax=Brevundimonas subvibrioides TaxID=74313 RepID=UPI0022B3A584|nr:hypothetical protein [Brevundimonas subvibrioides]
MIAVLTALLVTLFAAPGQTSADPYAVGQVWEYRTRPQEPQSLLMIREIEDGGVVGRIYHISITGIRPDAGWGPTEIAHAPVSRQTLDASVTRLSAKHPEMPDYRPGIAEWRGAHGGVFTIGVAEILNVIDLQLSGMPR